MKSVMSNLLLLHLPVVCMRTLFWKLVVAFVAIVGTAGIQLLWQTQAIATEQSTFLYCARDEIGLCRFQDGCIAGPVGPIYSPVLAGQFFDDFIIDIDERAIHTGCLVPSINCTHRIFYDIIDGMAVVNGKNQQFEVYLLNRALYGTKPQYLTVDMIDRQSAQYRHVTFNHIGSVMETGECTPIEIKEKEKEILHLNWTPILERLREEFE